MDTIYSLFSSAAVYLLNLQQLLLVGAAGSTLSGFITGLFSGHTFNKQLKRENLQLAVFTPFNNFSQQ